MMNINFKYKELKQQNIEEVTEENYIEIYNNLTKELEEEITKKYKNKLTHYNYIKLLKDIDNSMTYLKNQSFIEYQEEIIKLLNSIAKIRKKVFEISISKKLEIFMCYIEHNEIPTQTNTTKFCDIDTSVKDSCYVGKWFRSQLYGNLETLTEELEKYKNIYPNAYKKVIKLIKKIPKNKNITKSTKRKIEIFLKNLENGTIDLPMKQTNLTFLALEPTSKSKTNVKDWLKNIITKNREEFIKVCEESKEIYPNAYIKLIEFLPEEDRIHLDTEQRLILLMKYVNDKVLPNKNSKLTFYDIDNKYNDKRMVMTWFYEKVVADQKESNIYLEKYKEQYPLGYCRINNKINEINQENQNKKKSKELNAQEKIKIIMKYLETHDMLTNQNKITFKDLVPNATGVITLYSWTMNNILIDKNKVFEIIEQYKDTCPKACQKLYIKFRQLETERYHVKQTISFEEKVKVFMSYINENKIPSEASYLRFCNIEKSIEDTTFVGFWMRDQMFKNLYRFIIEINKYKDIYPVAYTNITNRINSSASRINKNRKKLIYTLKAIKEDLENNETKYKIQIKK